MTVLPVVLDARPGYLAGGCCESLLDAPAGREVVRDYFLRMLRAIAIEPPVLLSAERQPAGASANGKASQKGEEKNWRQISSLLELQDDCEPSDWLMLLDAAHPPLAPISTGAIREMLRDPRRSTFAAVEALRGSQADEHVAQDGERLHRVERFYHGVTAGDVSHFAFAVIPGVALRRLPETHAGELSVFRQQLVQAGLLVQDAWSPLETADLRSPRGFAAFNLHLLRNGNQRGLRGARASSKDIASTVRVIGDVAIHAGARIEDGAVVIGPAVLGAHSLIASGAKVARSILLPGAHVSTNEILCHALVTDRQARQLEADSVEDPAPSHAVYATADDPVTEDCPLERPRRRYQAVKRCFDAAVSLAALIALSPLMALVAAAVKLTSRGPIFYADWREGRDGRAIRCLKFRTMIVNAAALQRRLYRQNQVDGPQFKLRRDPRLTPVGGILRKLNLDELPQLINVLRGDMSLVGPRPSPFRENQICVAWRNARLSVRPGITGLWQMCRNERDHGDFHQWIQYDMLYVEHLGPGLDAKILLVTALTGGGIWPVPLNWFLPERRDRADSQRVWPTRAPILALTSEAGDSSERPPDAALPEEHTTAAPRSPRAWSEAVWLEHLRQLSIARLKEMFDPQARRFIFSARRGDRDILLEGASTRYTAITLLGLAQVGRAEAREVLSGTDPAELASALIDDLPCVRNLGDAALILWAACATGATGVSRARARLEVLLARSGHAETVELAWALTGLCQYSFAHPEDSLRAHLAERLLAAQRASGLFPHRIDGRGGLRAHVCCFADVVYPIQALAQYGRVSGDERALAAAERCAAHMRGHQGRAGQWWWHFDIRTGAVVEHYPVYAVHQDAMAPMALFELMEAIGADYSAAIARGVHWLRSAPELRGGSLVDEQRGMIWRKVARAEYGKFSRSCQALASRLHPACRAPGLDAFCPPGEIDFESRPYHLGWLLYAWTPARIQQWRGKEHDHADQTSTLPPDRAVRRTG